MKTSIKKLPKSEIELNIGISTEEFDKFLEKAVFKLGKDLEIKVNGFRGGRAPREILEKVIGKEKILQEAANLAIKENYLKAVFENKIEVISPPKIEILKLAPKNPFEFKAIVSVLPKIELPDYRKIASEVKKRKIFVKDEEIEDSLLWLQRSRAKFIFKNSPCQDGDFVEIEFTEDITNQKSKDAFILGKGHLIPGMEEKLFGMSAGEEKSFSITFPKGHFRKELAGKKTQIRVKMKSVQKVEFPEINDQFAQSLGRFENLNGLKQNIKEGIYREKEIRESQRVRGEILERIAQGATSSGGRTLEIPQILIDRERKRIIENLKKLVAQNLKISFQDYLARIKKTEKQLFDSLLPQAKKTVKDSLIVREIAKQEKIEVSPEEVRDEINKILKRYPSIEKAEKELDLARLKNYTKEAIRNEKTLARLESFAQK